METTQRCLLADIYGFCQRNKNLTENKEPAPQKTSDVTHSVKSDTKPSASNTDKNIKSTNSLPSETEPKSDNLLQIEPTQQKSRFDFKNLGGFSFNTSRFRITRIFESGHSTGSTPSESSPSIATNSSTETPQTTETQEDLLISCDDSSSSEGEGLLVDIDPEPSPSMDVSTELERLELDVFESDSSSSQDTDWECRVDNYACGSRESVDSMGTPIARSDLDPGEYK